MTVFELLSNGFEPAALGDSVGQTLSHAQERGHRIVPVVDEDRRLVAIAKTAELGVAKNQDTTLRDGPLNPPIFVPADAHLYDAVEVVVNSEVDLLPVVDETGAYLGCIDLSGLLKSVSRTLGIGESGSIIEIDMPPRDYTLGRLVHTIEEHGARVLSIYSDGRRHPDADVRVVVKVSVTDTVRIRAVLEHYGYHVVAVDRENSTAEDIQQRVREFIHYLDV